MTTRRHFWNFHSAGRVVFGSGSVARLGEFLRPWKPSRVLIVTDAMLIRAGVVSQVEAPLRAAGLDVSVFDGGQPEPACAIAEAALSQAKTARPDVIPCSVKKSISLRTSLCSSQLWRIRLSRSWPIPLTCSRKSGVFSKTSRVRS